mmetsp:Transcript_46664/g.109264  ORF Transcript_46664/g.109264 Transcript_46664/m.109264 type:complete len:128 (+) Transcript_46664:1083-1466(+)
MSVHTRSKKLKSCEMNTIVLLPPACAKHSSNHVFPAASKWFVGSSRTSTWGGRKVAAAKATRLRSPPERHLMGETAKRPRPKLPRCERTSPSVRSGCRSHKASRAVALPGKLSAWCWLKKPTTTRGC